LYICKWILPQVCPGAYGGFYHRFVLGLMVDLRGRCIITFNRESGFDRYDVKG
jgi:hypothetical protein